MLALVDICCCCIWLPQVRATEPPESGSISVQCPVHKAVSITIDLTNPLDKPVTFKAFFNVPELVGPSRFQVPPGATGVYECYFAPLLLGSSDGIVRLINDEVRGGVAYQYILVFAPCNIAQHSSSMRTQLGRVLPLTSPTCPYMIEQPTSCDLHPSGCLTYYV